MESKFLKKKINILTENTNGEMYLLEADDYNELVNDYHGERSVIPALNARVYFASYNSKPINPYAYTDFASCVKYIREEAFKE